MNQLVGNTAINFVFAGDLMVGGEFISYAEKRKLSHLYPFERIEPHISGADIFFLNLEGPIFQGSDRRPDVTTILSNNAHVIDLLTRQGICVLSLSNNHIMDYGVEGLNHTTALLKKSNLYYVGAGRNREEAGRELIIEHKGRRIAFLAFTTNESHVNAIIADSQTAGCDSFLDRDRIAQKIRILSENVDIICVSLHWGHEFFLYPSWEQINMARSLVDAGAKYVIGHHPHVAQGIEEYKGSIIMYSLGNLFFPPVKSIYGRPEATKRISRECMLVKSKIWEGKNLTFEIAGGSWGKDYRIVPFEGDHHRIFCSRIYAQSKALHSKTYGQFWLNYKERRERELKKEALLEALRKALMMPLSDLAKSITLSDVTRNMTRLYELFCRSKDRKSKGLIAH